MQTQNLLRRYLALSRPAQPKDLPDTLTEVAYPDFTMVVSRFWSVSAETLGTEFGRMARVYGLNSGDTVCVASGGWGYNLADQLKTRPKITYPGSRKFGDDLSVFRVVVGTEPTAGNLARRNGRAAQDLERLALMLARQRPSDIRSVLWPTGLLTDSTYLVTRALTDHTVSYYELYTALQNDVSRFQMYLPALAFWEINPRERHPEPMAFMNDLENYVAGGYRFTLLAIGEDSLGAVYRIERAPDN
jgi:hypothetical protein